MTGTSGGMPFPPQTLVGRAAPGGPVDDLVIENGRWATKPGEVVLETGGGDLGGLGFSVGSTMTVGSGPDRQILTVVGLANSITGSASGWVVPAEIPALRAAGGTGATQMLYRFADAAIGGPLHARCRQALRSPATRCAHRNDVVLHREDRRGRQHRPLCPVPARLRDPRDRDVGADRRERRRRRRRLGVPADRDPQEHRIHARPGCGRLRSSGRAAGPRRLPARRRGRQPARDTAPSAERRRLRRRTARRADLGRRRRSGRDLRPRCDRRAPARAARRTAQLRSGNRDRTRPTDRPRLRRAPAIRAHATAPPRHDRARRPIRAPLAHALDARRGPARRHRHHVRVRADLVARAPTRRDLAPAGRAGADRHARKRRSRRVPSA